MSNKYSERQGSRKNPYSSISPKDFEKMCRTVDQAFSQLAKASDKRVASVSAPVQPAPQIDVAKGRFKSTTGLTVGGVILVLLGAPGVLLLCNSAMVAVMAYMAFGVMAEEEILALAVLSLFAIGFFILLVVGIGNLFTASHVKAFKRAFGPSEALLFTDLATRLGTKPEQARKWAKKLLKRGYIPEGNIDEEGTTLMVTANAFQQYLAQCKSKQLLLEKQEADAKARKAADEARAAHEQDLEKRLTPEQRAFLAEGREYQAQLRQLDVLIDDQLVSERIVAIEDVLARILARAEEEPSIILGIDRLTNYYLPTTVKLLTSYDNLEDQPIQGDNVTASRREIEKTLEVLRAAFEKLLDDTYYDMSIDVSTEVSVLHSVLAREGLVEGPFDMKPNE